MKKKKKNWIKYIFGFIVCLLVRFIPFRPPNIEIILTTQMPFSKIYGGIAGFLFGFLSMFLFDVITAKVGMWSLITALTYGFLGLWASIYFKNKENNSLNYTKFAIMGTLAFDILTGLSIGPIFFHQNFTNALIGQIPFTVLHLVGNISFAILLSPIIYRYIMESKKLENLSLGIFSQKQV